MFTENRSEIKVKYVKNGVYSVLNSYPCLVWWVCRQWDRWSQRQWLLLQWNQPRWHTWDTFETLSFRMDGLSRFQYSSSEVNRHHYYGTFPSLSVKYHSLTRFNMVTARFFCQNFKFFAIHILKNFQFFENHLTSILSIPSISNRPDWRFNT